MLQYCVPLMQIVDLKSQLKVLQAERDGLLEEKNKKVRAVLPSTFINFRETSSILYLGMAKEIFCHKVLVRCS